MEKNQNYKKYLDVFLAGEKPFAVLLDGEWGVGKTHFIKDYMQKRNSQAGKDSKHAYVSLYGLATIEELEAKKFQKYLSYVGI